MSESSFPRLGILGAGTMGSGIALAALYQDLPVLLYDVDQGALARARDYISGHLTRKGKEAALEALRLTDRLEEVRGCEVVIEAAPEDLALKQDLFRQLDGLCPPPAVLATNTSTLPVAAIAAATGSPERVAGMHFFNPAAVLPLVEVVRAPRTAQETVDRLVALAERLGKRPVVVRDTPGFIVNRVARPFYGEALRLLAEGVAPVSVVDRIVTLGGGFRMGPFRLMDLIGIDVNFAAMKSMYEQTFGEPRYQPHWIQERLVLEGALGRKTGRGFYRYDGEEAEEVIPPEPQPGRGRMVVSPGTWAPGLADLLTSLGYEVLPEPTGEALAGWMVSGRAEGAAARLRRLDLRLPPEVPLFAQAADATVAEMAGWVAHPARLIGFDGLFFAAGRAATLVAAPGLAEGVRRRAEDLVRRLGRLPFWVEDGPALVLPRIVCALVNEAAFALQEGVAGAETIDLAMRLGVNYPQGPLAWGEQLGWPRVVDVLDHLQRETGEPRYRVAPWLRRRARLAALSPTAEDTTRAG